MSTLFKGISKEDLKIEKTKPALLAPEIFVQPGMSGIAKFFLTLSFTLAILCLAASGYLYYQSRVEQKVWTSLEASQVQLREKIESLEAESGAYRSEIAKLNDRLGSLAQENANIKREITNQHTAISGLQRDMKDVKDRAFPAAEISLFDVPETAAPKPASAVTSAAVIAPSAAKPAVPAPAKAPSVSAPSPAVKTTPRILTVNRKFKFVVVNVGLKEKMTMGQQLIVERNAKKIGTIAVEKLYDNFSAATIVEETKNVSMQEGDTVRSAS